MMTHRVPRARHAARGMRQQMEAPERVCQRIDIADDGLYTVVHRTGARRHAASVAAQVQIRHLKPALASAAVTPVRPQ